MVQIYEQICRKFVYTLGNAEPHHWLSLHRNREKAADINFASANFVVSENFRQMNELDPP
jgi:hypothetical protein